MTDVFTTTYSVEDILRVGVALIVLISVTLAVLYAIWGGFLMVLSGGSEEKVQKAVNYIRYAALGVVVLVIILFVIPLFMNFIGLSAYGQYFHPNTVLQSVRELAVWIMNG